MEEPQQRRSSGHIKKNRTFSYQNQYFLRSDDGDDVMRTDAVDAQDVQANSTFSSQCITHYTRLLLKVGLWIIFAWILSYLHLGAPCFLLPLILWLYPGPMHRALNRAKEASEEPTCVNCN